MKTRLLCLCLLLSALSGFALPRLGGMQNVWEVGTPPVYVAEPFTSLSQWGGGPITGSVFAGIAANAGGYLTLTNGFYSGSWLWYDNLIQKTNWWVHNENFAIGWSEVLLNTNSWGGPDTGVGVGVLDQYPPTAAADSTSYYVRLSHTNGQAVLTKYNPNDSSSGNNVDFAFSTSNLTFASSSDRIIGQFGREFNFIYGWYSNVANGSYTFVGTNLQMFGNGGGFVDPTIAHLMIIPYAGKLLVSNYTYTSTIKPPLAIVELGASRTYGQAAGEQRRRWITMVNTNLLTFKIRYHGNSWGRIEEWFAGLPELQALHPYEAILGEPDNTVSLGSDTESSAEQLYTNYVYALGTNSVRRVRHITAMPRGDHDNTLLAQFVRTNYPGGTNYPSATFVDAWMWTTNGAAAWLPLFNYDGTHPNFIGHETIATNILSSFFGLTPYPFTGPDAHSCPNILTNYSGDWSFGSEFDMTFYSYVALPFTVTGTGHSVGGCDFRLFTSGSPADFRAAVYTSSSGHPGTLVGSWGPYFNRSTINPIVGYPTSTIIPFSSISGIASGTLSAGNYFIVLNDTADGSNFLRLIGSGSGSYWVSTDGTTWGGLSGVGIYYIVRGK